MKTTTETCWHSSRSSQVRLPMVPTTDADGKHFTRPVIQEDELNQI